MIHALLTDEYVDHRELVTVDGAMLWTSPLTCAVGRRSERSGG